MPQVLCLGIVTFQGLCIVTFQGVAWPGGTYSMAIRPFEEHPHDLNRKWKPTHVDCTHYLESRQVRQKMSRMHGTLNK